MEISGLDCKIHLAANEPEHFHSEVELIFVLDGTLNICITGSHFVLEKDDILIINSNKWHNITVQSQAIVLKIEISYEMLQRYCRSPHIVFWCNTVLGNDESYEELRHILQQIVLLELSHDESRSFEKYENHFRFLNCITSNFPVLSDDRPKTETSKTDDTIQKILRQVARDYRAPMNLADIAAKYYLSTSTLSRLLKKAVGMSFPDYVNRIRIRHAVDNLLYTNKSITDIAMECGFSTPSAFNRIFRSIYNDSPTNYRKSLRSKSDMNGGQTLPEPALRIVKEYLRSSTLEGKPSKQEETVVLPNQCMRKFESISNICVNVGAVHRLSHSMMQEQIRVLAEQLHLRYVRVWNIFAPEMIVRGPNPLGGIRLNFHKLDNILDFLSTISVYPYLDLAARPDVAVRNGGTLVYRKDDYPGFRSQLEWENAMRDLVAHLLRRYGTKEVNRWIIGLSNPVHDQDISYYPAADYYEVFDFGYRLFKESFPECQVGGCAYPLNDDTDLWAEFYKPWSELHCIPDFLSVIVFPYSSTEDGQDIYEKRRVIDEGFIPKQIQAFKRMLSSINFPERPIFVAELSSFLSSRNFLNDHCHKGTAVLKGAQALGQEVAMLCYWTATDLLSLYNDTDSILFGGNGLFTKDGIRKPSYYALSFLAGMEKNLIKEGPGYWATTDGTGTISILCWNFQKLSYRYLLREENLFRVTEVGDLFENGGDRKLRFVLEGFNQKLDYTMTRSKINCESGSILNEWKKLSYEKNLCPSNVEYLKRICIPHMRMSHLVPRDGMLEFTVTLAPHEMQLIRISGYRNL